MKKIISIIILVIVFVGCGNDFEKNYEYNFDQNMSIGYTENIEFSEISNLYPKELFYIKKTIDETALIELLICNNNEDSTLKIRAENGFRIWGKNGNIDNIIIYNISQDVAIVAPRDSQEITSDDYLGEEQVIGFRFKEECKKYYIEIL